MSRSRRKARTVATLEITSAIEEIFDVQTVPEARCLALGGSPGGGDEIWLIPRPTAIS